jgi:hypothetical protein
MLPESISRRVLMSFESYSKELLHPDSNQAFFNFLVPLQFSPNVSLRLSPHFDLTHKLGFTLQHRRK